MVVYIYIFHGRVFVLSGRDGRVLFSLWRRWSSAFFIMAEMDEYFFYPWSTFYQGSGLLLFLVSSLSIMSILLSKPSVVDKELAKKKKKKNSNSPDLCFLPHGPDGRVHFIYHQSFT